jgi:hypothetical protein
MNHYGFNGQLSNIRRVRTVKLGAEQFWEV